VSKTRGLPRRGTPRHSAFREFATELVREELASQAEVDAIAAELARVSADETTLLGFPLLVQVLGSGQVSEGTKKRTGASVLSADPDPRFFERSEERGVSLSYGPVWTGVTERSRGA
jgi:hypothetical protein